MHPDCHLQALSSDASEHCPLLLQTRMAIHAKPRFHFEAFWPKLEGYLEAVARGWTCPDTITDPLRRLDTMMRNLKKELQWWSASKIRNVREQLLMAREIILKLDQAIERRSLTDAEFELRKDLKFKCLGLSSLQRTIARQRSRFRYLADDDANTKYFHLLARGRKQKNTITRLHDGDNTCSTHEDIEMALYSHFKQVFGQPGQAGYELVF
jgi:hypothetical protein